MYKYKTKAFTLSEILITLALVGIIAALTIPTLINNTNNSSYTAGFLRANKILKEAAVKLMANNAGTMAGIYTSDNEVRNGFCSVLDCFETCDAGAVSGNCFSSGFTTLDGSAYTTDQNTVSAAVLSNGMSLTFDYIDSDSGRILVDINGMSSPNRLGRDVFAFEYDGSRIWVYGIAEYNPWGASTCNPSATSDTNGIACGGRIIEESNRMNY